MASDEIRCDCPYCFQPITEDTQVCPHCTRDVPNAAGLSGGDLDDAIEQLIKWACYAVAFAIAFGWGLSELGDYFHWIIFVGDWVLLPILLVGAIAAGLLHSKLPPH